MPVLEELDCALMLLCLRKRVERAKIPLPACLWIYLSRIEAVFP
jgi:hypothetical protein